MSDEDNESSTTEEEQMRLWRERYGGMIPEKIVDTKIGEDGRRYYKVQWAASSMEPSRNFLEAELLVQKYWDPVEKKLKLPSHDAPSTNEYTNEVNSSHGNNSSITTACICDDAENIETKSAAPDHQNKIDSGEPNGKKASNGTQQKKDDDEEKTEKVTKEKSQTVRMRCGTKDIITEETSESELRKNIQNNDTRKRKNDEADVSTSNETEKSEKKRAKISNS